MQWLAILQDGGAQVAWLGLHGDDNDPHWFLAHLLEAVRRALPSAGEAIGDLAALIEQNAEDMQGYVLSALLEVIGDVDGRFVIAFDDWHLVDDSGARRALVHLLDFAPPNLAIVLTSRRRPQLPLSRLRVRGHLVEIDADLLRFDLDETREFLVELNGLRLDGDDVARLSAGTDGWVAALQLASLSLRDSADPAALIRGFSGRHHSVGEYLAENVLDALPADVLDFLLATSVCDRLCGDLAGVLAGRGDGQAMLEELESRDLFLRPLDTEREWFRYHHLFADYLRRRLDRDHPDRVVELHSRASAWFAEQALVPEAVAHALSGGDIRRATDLVEQHAMPLVEHSRMVSLLGLLGRLPGTAADDRPGLLMAVAWANCLLQRSAAAQASLDALRPGAVDRGRIRGDAQRGRRGAGVHRRLRRPHRPGRGPGRAQPPVRTQLPAVGGGGGGEHPVLLRHPRDAVRRRPRAAALGRPVPRADHRPVLRRVRPLLRRDRRALTTRHPRGAGAARGRRRPGAAGRRGAARTPPSWPARCSGSCTTSGARSPRPNGCWTRAASSGPRAGSSTS